MPFDPEIHLNHCVHENLKYCVQCELVYCLACANIWFNNKNYNYNTAFSVPGISHNNTAFSTPDISHINQHDILRTGETTYTTTDTRRRPSPPGLGGVSSSA